MKKQLLYASLFFTLLSSCVSPLPISRLSSEEPQGKWVAGRKYVTQTQGDYSMTLSFYKSDGDLLLFDALFENLDGSEVEFSPMQARIIALNSEKSVISTLYPLDPESKLLEFDKSESRERARLANQSISNAVATTSDLVATVIEESDPNISRQQADANYNQREWDRQNRLADMDRQEAYLESIKNTRLYWEEAPIRRTTVGSNEYIEGRMFFERTEEASFYTITFDIPNVGKFEFNYKHELITPY
ncbi:MAG: hypothetical protein JJ909_08770 [Roseivirga sp.]|uniref:hypothetical protein n=1 Tax=Roseivirga sp. TaxID=1964215 RepID=UPI001B2BB8F3|nr:hypothetical protein [Roseivirga sp.]MBO6660853.1 hypothetical protein [Roseivirga sp.]MBO6761048.1 hypothetical protein [Roseivirga sp.]MBO6909163.1 hypothetical protein [Roseivirga sp.]